MRTLLMLFMLCPSIFLAQETTSINFQNTERSNHTTLYDGLLTYDLNFYTDYPEIDSDGGGLNIYSGEDGWGAVFDTNNMKYLTPEFKGLQVNGESILKPNLINNNYFQVKSNTDNQVNLLMYTHNQAQWNFYAQDDGRLIFKRTTNNPDGGVKMALKGNFVGIGTTSPSSLLDLKSSNNNRLRFNYQDTPSIGFVPNNGNSIFHISHTLDNRLTISQGSNVAQNELVTIHNSGSVGIGTTNPGVYKLAVKGKIRAEEIKVETGWADYVFREGYRLPTLKEVERHIKENGHLINIPSAKEVKANGIQLGEMNKLLLEKIEELTLYTLQQQNLLEVQDKENKELKNRLEKLERYLGIK